jgi:hypothetical protein
VSERADSAQSPHHCEIYAVGNNVVYAHSKPPMPPQHFMRHDAMTEPCVRIEGRAAAARSRQATARDHVRPGG